MGLCVYMRSHILWVTWMTLLATQRLYRQKMGLLGVGIDALWQSCWTPRRQWVGRRNILHSILLYLLRYLAYIDAIGNFVSYTGLFSETLRRVKRWRTSESFPTGRAGEDQRQRGRYNQMQSSLAASRTIRQPWFLLGLSRVAETSSTCDYTLALDSGFMSKPLMLFCNPPFERHIGRSAHLRIK